MATQVVGQIDDQAIDGEAQISAHAGAGSQVAPKRAAGAACRTPTPSNTSRSCIRYAISPGPHAIATVGNTLWLLLLWAAAINQ